MEIYIPAATKPRRFANRLTLNFLFSFIVCPEIKKFSGQLKNATVKKGCLYRRVVFVVKCGMLSVALATTYRLPVQVIDSPGCIRDYLLE